jgi:hypothetical protein
MDLFIARDTFSTKRILHIVSTFPNRSSEEFLTRKNWVVIGICCGIFCSRGYDELWGIGLIIVVRELINSYIYRSPNYRIVTLVPSVWAASLYITISSTLTVVEVIFVAYLEILVVPKVATSLDWLGGLDHTRPVSPLVWPMTKLNNVAAVKSSKPPTMSSDLIERCAGH